MDRKKLVLLVGALIVAIGTAMAARSMFAGSSAPQVVAAPVEPEGPKVLVAKRSLPVGTIITADAIGFQLWPQEMVQDAYFIDGNADMSMLMGTVVRHPITAGEPVTQGSLVAPGDRGFLAAALGPGMRAVTVSVSAQTGVGGFIFPGDRVDMMLTQTVSGDGPPLKTTETILRNLRVLATDQSTETRTTEDGKTVVSAFRTVTLEVTPKIAEKIEVAQTIGNLSLALRSIADNQSELDRAIAAGEIDMPEDASPEEERRLLRQATSLPRDGKSSFVTGGDVSRFQRTTIPPQNSGNDRGPAMEVTNSIGVPGAPSGPIVRVTRGKDTTAVPVRK
ncbi:pilus assembly protein CpaB [Altererythrobacter atlanticus]|uniref:SAF domain protein n=1 Tax=Croceibacterium atlanticum TaxID=1267766 RepID=A0A0F7KTH9_9SPHN|nr:Flp pilus assembly protein CpaB [Croceibacterium atlanticum]AKH42446.1 SAF domain protein [Croceibacterium atlanticum]MBB5731223.1 pilus assembly protein CpaB [Croceibacterium atlanticum]